MIQESIENDEPDEEIQEDDADLTYCLERWLKRDIDQRFQLLWDTIYRTSAQDYQKPSYQCKPKVSPKDCVVVYTDDLFWNAEIVGFASAPVICEEGGRLMPAYEIRYAAWPDNYNEQNVAEWDIWATSGRHFYCFQMLYAYYWNRYALSKEEHANKGLPKGVYSPTAEIVQIHEEMWMREADGCVNVSFADFIGMPTQL